jgi:NAD-dependent deacetylase
VKAARQLAQAIRDAGTGLILVVTGAGISTASGIPTFRGSDPGAIWKESDVSKATLDYFRRDPVGHWHWYLARFSSLDGARPNSAHDALAALERWQTERAGRLRIITQNIDTLHERAGSRDLIKVHGTSDRLRCARAGCVNGAPRGSLPRTEIDLAPFVAEPSLATLPRCALCQELLRAHVLFFDEYYQEHSDYRFADVQSSAFQADLVIFVGTSFSVGVTDLIVQSAGNRAKPMFSIDPHAPPLPRWMDVTELREPAEDALPGAVSILASA